MVPVKVASLFLPVGLNPRLTNEFEGSAEKGDLGGIEVGSFGMGSQCLTPKSNLVSVL